MRVLLPLFFSALLLLALSNCNSADNDHHGDKKTEAVSTPNDSLRIYDSLMKVWADTSYHGGNITIKNVDIPKIGDRLLKDTILDHASLVFSTPVWGDGKNADGSYIRGILRVKLKNHNAYWARGKFVDGSVISSNSVRTMDLVFDEPDDFSKITSRNIDSVFVTFEFGKPDQGILSHDVWNFRVEGLLYFADKSTQATGYIEPAGYIPFGEYFQTWSRIAVSRKNMYIKPTLVPPYQ